MTQYYSQFEQDKVISGKYFPGKTDGFFIEIGADDGVDKSNTYYFEQLGWKGLCIEPSPSRFAQLTKNRTCECINLALASKEGSVEFMDITGYGKGLSGIIDNYNPLHKQRIERETTSNPLTLSKQKVTVTTVRLDKLLRERNITRVNYCSIDVEGSELDILRSIDFEVVTFDLFTIEDPYESAEVRNLMNKNGFVLKETLGPDLLYVNSKSFSV
jgi:FkbM family methyltransferase